MGYLPPKNAGQSSWDVVVVGAGPAGVLATHRLRRLGCRVLLVDAGPRLACRHRVPEVDPRQWPYVAEGGSYDWFRVRAVGGRSLSWGGWSFRLPQSALERAGWPFGADTLAPWYRQAERLMRVRTGALDNRYVRAARSLDLSIVPKRGACQLNGEVWAAVGGRSARSAHTYAVAVNLKHERRCVNTVELFDLRTERTHHVPTRSVVLAASPFETARLLFVSAPHLFGNRTSLVDHMVAGLVLVEPAAPPTTEGRGPFPGAALVESFVNTGAGSERPYPGSFCMELNGPFSLDVLGIERMVPSAELACHRATTIYSIGELFPNPSRVVELDGDRLDVAGRPIPRFHVNWTEAEKQLATDMRQACRRLADEIAIPGSRVVALTDPLVAGAGHEAGTFPFGADETSPTDVWGRLKELKNVWLADASVLPTAGDRHPTLTVAAHALRTTESVTRWLIGHRSSG